MNEERFGAFLRHNPSLLFLKDEEGKYVYLNPAYEKEYALTPDWLGKTDFDFWPKESAELFRQNDLKTLESGEVCQFLEDSVDRNGKRHCWLCYKFPFTDSQGTRYVGGIGIDSTARVLAEEALRESEKKYSTLFEKSPLAISLSLADTGELVDVNQAWAVLFKISRQEALGKTTVELGISRDPEARARLYAELEQRGYVKDHEITSYYARSGEAPVLLVDQEMLDIRGRRYVLTLVRDITERKRAEEELRTAMGRLRTLFDHRIAGIGIGIANANGGIIQANDCYLDILGCTREELNSGLVDWRKTTPPEWLPADERALVQLRERGVCHTYEKEYQRRDGTRVPVIIADAMMPGDSGEILAFVFDMSARKRAEKELKDSEHRYRQLVQSSPEAIVVHNRGVFLYANAAALSLFGAPGLGRLQEKNLLDFIHPDDSPAVQERIQRLEKGEKLPPKELRLITLDGKEVQAEVYASRVTYDEHKAIQVIIRDITARKRTERLNHAMHHVDQAVHSTLKTQEVMQLALGKAREAIGCETAAISLREGECWRLTYALDFPDNLVGACMSDEEELHAVLAITTGTVVGISDAYNDPRVNREHMKKWGVRSVLVVPLIVKDKPLGVLLLNYHKKSVRFDPADLNFAERLAASLSLALENARLFESLEEKVRERTKELAVRADQLRALAGELTISEQRERKRLAGILHDHLQQILVGAKFRVSVLAKQTGDGETKSAAREIEDLIDESIKSSRSLTAELSPPILYESGLNAGLEWLGRRMADTQGLFVDLTAERVGPLPEDLTILVFESVRELLFNVAKHAGVKSASIEVRRIDGFLRVTVSDKGIGFDSNALPPAGAAGRGFGLFSIGERLELFSGKLEIESAPGQGSRFNISVPITGAQPASAAIAELPRGVVHKLIPTRAPGKRIRVLLADDHAIVRQGIANLLKDEPDIEIAGEAANGQEAVNLAARILPDVILMDMNMPILNGVEATRAIHKNNSEIRIIGLSMFEEAEKAQEMRDAGAVNFLTKSGPVEELIKAIRTETSRSKKDFIAMK